MFAAVRSDRLALHRIFLRGGCLLRPRASTRNRPAGCRPPLRPGPWSAGTPSWISSWATALARGLRLVEDHFQVLFDRHIGGAAGRMADHPDGACAALALNWRNGAAHLGCRPPPIEWCRHPGNRSPRSVARRHSWRRSPSGTRNGLQIGDNLTRRGGTHRPAAPPADVTALPRPRVRPCRQNRPGRGLAIVRHDRRRHPLAIEVERRARRTA